MSMHIKQRARSNLEKLKRKDAILVAAETLLRHSGHEAMTMQAVATESGLGKGTLYLYFSCRELLVLDVYRRLFDQWIDRLSSHLPTSNGVEQFCRDFYIFYTDDPLFLQLSGFVTPLMETQIDPESYIKCKRSEASRIKKLAGIAYRRLAISPTLAQRFVWGLLTIASGATQMTTLTRFENKNLPKDVTVFIRSTDFETVFLNAAVPLYVGMTQADR